MVKTLAIAAAACAFAFGRVNAQNPQPAYGQCGGIGWSGSKTCVSGSACTFISDYYSQCIPGATTATTTTTTTTTTTSTTPTTTTTTTTATSSGTFSTPPVPSAVPTLVNGYSFVRAVASPNFHKYLGSEVYGTPGDAVLRDYTSAPLFKVTNGQLIQGVEGKDTLLYAVVEPKTDSAAKKLKVSWSTNPATSGKFVFSGDTLEWSDPAITRQQNNAWLVCPDAQGNKDVYVNLGAYSYQTPAGCADQTIHAYTGPIAVD